jgi:hypothetical protein
LKGIGRRDDVAALAAHSGRFHRLAGARSRPVKPDHMPGTGLLSLNRT